MNVAPIIAQLAKTPGALEAWLSGMPIDRARHKPASGAWSIIEIMAHLVDEDRDDFRKRLKLTLERPGTPWPTNDPEAWARDREYATRDLEGMLTAFAREREESVRWLRSIERVDWTTAYQHPKVGPVTAGELMVSWLAHDALHVRQIAKRMFELAALDGADEGFKTTYAGEWGA